MLFGVPIVSLVMDGKERLCLAQISSTLLKEFSYNEIHNRRVALGKKGLVFNSLHMRLMFMFIIKY